MCGSIERGWCSRGSLRRSAATAQTEEEARDLIEQAVCVSVPQRARFERTFRGQEQALTD